MASNRNTVMGACFLANQTRLSITGDGLRHERLSDLARRRAGGVRGRLGRFWIIHARLMPTQSERRKSILSTASQTTYALLPDISPDLGDHNRVDP